MPSLLPAPLLLAHPSTWSGSELSAQRVSVSAPPATWFEPKCSSKTFMGNPHHPASGLTGYYAYWNFPVIGSYTTSDTSSSVSCQNSCEADNSCDAWLIGEDDSGAAGRCRLYSELAGVLTFACTQGNYVREPGNYGAVKLRVTDALGTMECDNRTRVDADNEKYERCPPTGALPSRDPTRSASGRWVSAGASAAPTVDATRGCWTRAASACNTAA